MQAFTKMMLPSLQKNEIGTSELDPFRIQYLACGFPVSLDSMVNADPFAAGNGVVNRRLSS